ncbi:phage head morphogenesis protein, partial [Desulfurobacterium sp.]
MKEKEEQTQFFSDGFDATFEEAVEFMKEKLSLTKEEFYTLDAKARFRAFTVAKLTGLDAIERVKEKLAKAIEEGKTLKEWIEELGEDGILKTAGFHRENPYYLETVFRTNISTAYNAGRLMQFARSRDRIKLLEYVAIEDSRTTPICRRLDGTRLPPDDPFWATYTPPNHFNCRSTVRAIFKGSSEAKRARVKKPEDIPPVPEGFAGSPLDSWWKLTDSMAKRIIEYGLKDEVLEKAKRMCGKNFEDWECPEFEEVKKILNTYGESWETLRRVLGENRKAPVKVGDIVPAGFRGWGETKVIKIYKDLLGNEI